MHRVLAVFLAASTVLSVVTDSQATARQPNVVVILADDQGWGDLSVNGNSNLSTPHIDSLARDGATMQHFYVCPVCAPTRAEFLTGRYYPRTGVSGVSEGSELLNADEKTIADYFKAAGYTTGAFGKWHNGTQPPLHPLNRGFDEYYGFTSGHWGHYFSPPLDHNGTRVRGKGFIVDDFTDHAIKFIESNQERPFFCYLPLNTPHSPMFVPDRFFEKFENWSPDLRHRDPEKEDIAMTRAALALCENIDWNVGSVLATLDKLQLQNDTIVVYFSDNGPNSWRWNGGMKGRKGSIDEGGVRSPFLSVGQDTFGAVRPIVRLAERLIFCQRSLSCLQSHTSLRNRLMDAALRYFFSVAKTESSGRTVSCSQHRSSRSVCELSSSGSITRGSCLICRATRASRSTSRRNMPHSQND